MTARQSIKRNQFYISLLLMTAGVVVFVILFKGLSLNPTIVSSTLIGKQAADIQIELIEENRFLPEKLGTTFKLSDLRGKRVILNFWASWCTSCREEARELETYWERHRSEGIIVLGMAIQDTTEAAKQFAKTMGKSYPIALDRTGKTSLDYGVYGVPETFIINSDGKILHKEAGPVSASLLEEINSKFPTNPSGQG